MSRAQRTGKGARFSLRRGAFIGSVVFAIVAFVDVLALVGITTSLERAIDTVVRDTRSQALADQLELNLFTYQRLSNLFVLTKEAPIDEARRSLAAQMRETLDLAPDYSGSAKEDELIGEVARHLATYLQKRKQVETRGLTVVEAVTASRSELNDTVASVESLRDLNRIQVDQTHSTARRLNRLANLTGWIAGATIVIGFLLVALGVRWYMLRPILAVHGAMARFQTGEEGARGTGGGPREIAQLAQGFNEMADTLVQQRQQQLVFLAGVAHDLRNPLNGLKLGLYAFEQEQSQGKRARLRERLDRQVERLSRMVDDLLDATRIEAGSLELRTEDLDIREVVDDMVRLYGPTSLEHQISAEQPPEPVIVHGDSLRLEQVVSNLLSNAIKFSPSGGPIRISVEVQSGEATVAVSDQGVGILPEEMPYLFVPFRRRQQEVIPGSGLGLSVVRRIVTAHGGRIEVDSEPGVGTTFRIKLPLATQASVT